MGWNYRPWNYTYSYAFIIRTWSLFDTILLPPTPRVFCPLTAVRNYVFVEDNCRGGGRTAERPQIWEFLASCPFATTAYSKLWGWTRIVFVWGRPLYTASVESKPFNEEGQASVFRVPCSYRDQVKIKVTLRLTVSQSVSIGVEPKSGTFDQGFFFQSYCLVFLGRPLYREVGSVTVILSVEEMPLPSTRLLVMAV
jgi:hypothetical protein